MYSSKLLDHFRFLDQLLGFSRLLNFIESKFFSRKQAVPALSSAEAEIISIVDTAKEMVSLGMLLQTMIQGIALDPLGKMGLTMFNDAKAAVSMGKMDGLLRRVRHLELRVKYCQHLYRRRQLSLTHWRGADLVFLFCFVFLERIDSNNKTSR